MGQLKDKPIPFSTEMVQAILEGRKTQTRRVIKPQPSKGLVDSTRVDRIDVDSVAFMVDGGFEYQTIKCPYQIGQRLWVKETWAKVPMTAYWHDLTIPHQELKNSDARGDGWWTIYKAGWERVSPGWKSSRFMPRWASRITLEVVSIRAERLQKISHDDALAEGVPCSAWSEMDWDDDDYPTSYMKRDQRAVEEFEELWDRLNGKTYPWSSNPWVWVIEFKVVVPCNGEK